MYIDRINNCITALITPFKNDKVDYTSLEKIINIQVQNNMSILVCGTTGETSTLEDEEYEEIIKFVVRKVNKKVPIMAGCGSNSTKKTIEKAKLCESFGVDCLLIVSPYYNKTTQEGLYKHYETIAQNTNLPIILYNVPARTGLDINSDTVIKLSKISNIIGIKEASCDILKVQEILYGTNEKFLVYSGNDDMVLPFMSIGAKGVISVISNIYPKQIRNMVEFFLEGETKKAYELQLKISMLSKLIFCETNPIPIKKACSYLGLCENELRLPLVPMSKENSKKLINFIDSFYE